MEQKITIEEQLKKDGYLVSTTAGFSMWPMLKNRRDRVIVRAYTVGESPKQNDLLLYRRSDGKYVLHRALWVNRECSIARGDNTFYLEEVKPEQVLGRVTEFYRKDRHCTVDMGFYKVYVWVWRILFPLRALFHWGKIWFFRLGSLVKRGVKKVWKKIKNQKS